MFRYYCITEFLYVYQSTTSLTKPEIFFLKKKLHIANPLIFMFIIMLIYNVEKPITFAVLER